MTQLQEEFLSELKSNPKFTVPEYAALYHKHIKLAMQEEEKNGANEHQAKAMANYYTLTVLSDFVGNQNKLDRILALKE